MLDSTHSTQNTKSKKCKIKSKAPERSNLITYIDNNHSGMWMTFTPAIFLKNLKPNQSVPYPGPHGPKNDAPEASECPAHMC